jgi:hypothetical protein
MLERVKLDWKIVEEVLARTEGQSHAQRAQEIVRKLEETKLPPRHAVGGIITPQ